ncbi:unnamed protein product, partial [Darwinula stevensoni]
KMNTQFPEYKQLDLVKIAEEELNFWKENDIFEKSISSRDGQPPYVFYEGPPSANDLEGIRAIITRAGQYHYSDIEQAAIELKKLAE